MRLLLRLAFGTAPGAVLDKSETSCAVAYLFGSSHWFTIPGRLRPFVSAMNAFGDSITSTLQRLSSMNCINHCVYSKDVNNSLSGVTKALTMNAFDECLWLKRGRVLMVDIG